MLFLGWLLAAFLVVGAINLYLRFFGLPRSKKAGLGDSFRSGGPVPVSGGESCQWLNSALSWFYLHYSSTPEIVEAWIRALNEQARKHQIGQNGLQVKFDRIQTGSLPPRATSIKADPTTKDNLGLYVTVEASDMTLMVSAIQSTATNLKVTSCDVTLIKLLGQLRIRGDYSQETVHSTVTFAAPPDIKLNVNTRNYDTSIDKAEVERVVRASFAEATLYINLSSAGGYPNFSTPLVQGNNHDPFAMQNRNSLSPRTPTKDSRLLVKVIKANGLGDKDFGCTDPYCTVMVDYPAQSHTTSVVKNTVNPFWDEHFLFDFDDRTKQIKFEVYDREKPPSDDFLGRATIALDELRRLPSSRQIIPLTGRPRATTTTSGSVTIEFVFVDQDNISRMPNMPNASDSMSPRRRIETNTRMTPGGTMVTTTTTTTERPKDQRLDPFYDDTPNRIERPSMDRSTSRGSADYSPYSTTSRGSSHLEAHDAALSASQAATLPRGSTLGGSSYNTTSPGATSPTLTLTRPDNMAMQDVDNRGRDGRRDVLSISTTYGDVQKDKKKSTFASAFKKRFSRPKKRSQSADRAYSSSFKEGSLLKPPEYVDTGPQSRTAEDLDQAALRENLRKSRSHSFSNSLKRIFKKKKSKDGISRESSLSRASKEDSASHPSPHMSYRDAEYNHGDYSQTGQGQSDYSHDYSYSSSMPASKSPLSYEH